MLYISYHIYTCFSSLFYLRKLAPATCVHHRSSDATEVAQELSREKVQEQRLAHKQREQLLTDFV